MRWQPGTGEVVLFLEDGFVSPKKQVRSDFPILTRDSYADRDRWAWEVSGRRHWRGHRRDAKVEIAYWLSVAVPELEDSPGPLGAVRASAGGLNDHAAGARVENLSRAARITFDAEQPTILFKTILRGLTKYLASRGAEKAGGEWAGLAANLFGAVTESADTRGWLTLPADVWLVRLRLPAGTYDLHVDLKDRAGRSLGTQTLQGVAVKAGDWTFLSRRIFQSQD